MYDYPFTEAEAQEAYDTWFCNCGPASLAFALQVGLDKVRGVIPDFEEKHYTSPTMMRAALKTLKAKMMPIHTGNAVANMFAPCMSLVRVQWTGPWTKPGANPKWAYRQTHWIATWLGSSQAVFDCNSGITTFGEWQEKTVPTLTALYPRADGGWFPANIWRVEP